MGKGLWGRGAIALIILAAVSAMSAAIVFRYIVIEIDNEKYQERCSAVNRALNIYTADLVEEQIIRDSDWGTYDYDTIIGDAMSRIDAEPMTFAVAYRPEKPGDQEKYENIVTAADGTNYTVVSTRSESVAGAPFDPLLYPAFVAAAQQDSRGSLDLYFEPVIAAPRDMHTEFRWVPTPGSVDYPYLLIVAVSKYSVQTKTATWITAASVPLIMLYMVFAVLFIAYAKDKTHRPEEDKEYHATKNNI